MAATKKPLRPRIPPKCALFKSNNVLQGVAASSSTLKGFAPFASLDELLCRVAPRKRDLIMQLMRVKSLSSDGTVESQYNLLKTAIVACYESSILAEILANLLANGETLPREYNGISLSPAQLKSLPQSDHAAQAAIKSLTFACDVADHRYIQDPFAMDCLFRNLRTILEIFERRKNRDDVDLNKEFGFSMPGRGKRSQLSRNQSIYSWSENCFELHMLVLSGRSVAHACEIFSKDHRAGKKSSSQESLEKMYHRWRKEPITSIRLQIGDDLAKTILSQPASRQILANQFRLSSV